MNAAMQGQQSPFAAGRAEWPAQVISTRTLLPNERFEFWCEEFSPLHTVDVAKANRQNFEATASHWQLGPMIFGSYETPARRFFRTSKQSSQNDVDHFFLRTFRNAQSNVTTRTNAFTIEPGTVALGNYGHIYDETQTAGEWAAVIVPRDDIREIYGTSGEIRPLRGASAALLADYLLSLTKHLPDATAMEAPLISQILYDLIVASVTHPDAPPENALLLVRQRQLRAKVADIVASNISSPRLNADRVAKMAGVSRSTLYRAFDGHGGIAGFILRNRLDFIRRDLRSCRLSGAAISELAEKHGFHNTPSFNRAFRRYYGMTPGEFRKQAQGWPIQTSLRPADAGGARRFADLIRAWSVAKSDDFPEDAIEGPA